MHYQVVKHLLQQVVVECRVVVVFIEVLVNPWVSNILELRVSVFCSSNTIVLRLLCF